MLNHARRELFLLGGTVATALFGANDALDLFGSGSEYDKWVFFVAFLLLVGAMIWRVLKLHLQIDDYENKVRVTAKLANLSQNPPDTDDDKVSLQVRVDWEVWSEKDVSVERLALNMIYDYGKGWWQFWKKSRKPITGIPPNGESTYYRKRYNASADQPNTDHADFDYVADRESSKEAHWLLELVLITAIPKTEHRIPIFIDWDEMHSRGANPPL